MDQDWVSDTHRKEKRTQFCKMPSASSVLFEFSGHRVLTGFVVYAIDKSPDDILLFSFFFKCYPCLKGEVISIPGTQWKWRKSRSRRMFVFVFYPFLKAAGIQQA